MSVPLARMRLVPDALDSNAIASPSEDGASYLSEFISLPEVPSGFCGWIGRNHAEGRDSDQRVLYFGWPRKNAGISGGFFRFSRKSVPPMYAIDDKDRVVALGGVPAADAGAPMPLVVANEWNLFLSYGLAPGSQEQAILKFTSSRARYFGPPNDEALEGHPLSPRGLRPYGVFEIVGSSWIRSLERMNRVHSRHKPDRYEMLRHYVFTFHDSTFECIASGVDVVARFPNDTDSAEELLHKIATLMR
jgi:hypothetical protein